MENVYRAVMQLIIMSLACLVSACSPNSLPQRPLWAQEIDNELQVLGYRNWIVIAESSYPVHSRRGVRTVVVDAETPEVLDYVVDYFDRSEIVRPAFSTARELPFVKNDTAPGIDEFRKALEKALHGHDVRQMDHRSLTVMTQSDAKKFAVLVIKTKTALPYTNVYIELDSGYWDRDSEDKLRNDMKAHQQNELPKEAQPRGN